MTTIHSSNPGSCIEPGGYELADDSFKTECPDCGEPATQTTWEAVECGALNSYYRISCSHCGYEETNDVF